MSTSYPWNSDSSNLLQAYRKQSKLTLREAAKKLGIDYSLLSKIEMATRKPSFELLSRIADLYSMPLNVIKEVAEFYGLGNFADLKFIPTSNQQYTYFAEVKTKHTSNDGKEVNDTWTILKTKK